MYLRNPLLIVADVLNRVNNVFQNFDPSALKRPIIQPGETPPGLLSTIGIIGGNLIALPMLAAYFAIGCAMGGFVLASVAPFWLLQSVVNRCFPDTFMSSPLR